MDHKCTKMINDPENPGHMRQCTAYAVKFTDPPRCYLHSDQSDPRTLGALGGSRSKRKRNPAFDITRPPKTVEDIQDIMGQAIYNKIQGQLDPDVARDLTSMCNSWLKCHEELHNKRKIKEFEKALEKLQSKQ